MTIKEAIETLEANYPDTCFEQLRDAVDVAISALKQAERKTGHWERVSVDRYIRSANHACKCSRCGTVVIPDNGWCFCPACGAKMEVLNE